MDATGQIAPGLVDDHDVAQEKRAEIGLAVSAWLSGRKNNGPLGWSRPRVRYRASLATPTISNSRLVPALRPKCLPIGSSCGKNCRANASLTTATFRAVAVSSSEMSRPLRRGVPTTSKYPAVTRFHEGELSSLGPGAARPSTQTPAPQRRHLAASRGRARRKPRRECRRSNHGCGGRAARVPPTDSRQALD